MDQPSSANPWSEINGGLRGSTLLASGAILSILATWQNFASIVLATEGEPASQALVTCAWLCWILALWLLAAGFIWVGVQPFLSRLGLIVGLFHLINGVVIFAVLFLGFNSPLPGISLAIGRTLLLFFFVIAEKGYFSRFTVNALASVALLQFFKIALRTMEFVPQLHQNINAGLDSIILTLLAVCIILLGRNLKRVEDSWATELAATRSSGFGEFNNPEHEWNRGDD
jgi:hypothetical protein